MNIYLSEKEIALFSELKARYESLTDEEESELSALRKKNLKAQADRAKHLEALRAKIKELDAQITDLFSRKQISETALSLGLVKATSSDALKPGKTAAIKGPHRPSDRNPILLDFAVKGVKGRSLTYRAGRVFEPFNGKVKIPFPYKKVSARFLEAGSSESELRKYLTEDGVKYFSTEDGRRELKAILDFITEARKRMGK